MGRVGIIFKEKHQLNTLAADWATEPLGALVTVEESYRLPTDHSSLADLTQHVATKACGGDFLPVPNIRNTWRKTIDVGGSKRVVIAVQTQL